MWHDRRRKELLLTAPIKGPDEDQTPEEDKNLVELARDAALSTKDSIKNSIVDTALQAKDSITESTDSVRNISVSDVKMATANIVRSGVSQLNDGMSAGLKVLTGEDEDSDDGDEEIFEEDLNFPDDADLEMAATPAESGGIVASQTAGSSSTRI